MVYPILPLFITQTLGAPVLAVGVTEGFAEGLANITKLLSGRWSDRISARKPFVVAGYALAAAGKFFLALATAWPFALAGRGIDRFGKGIRTAPRDAMLADFTDAGNRGKVFGLHRSMDTLGAVVGPLVGLGLLQLAGDRLRLVIMLAVIPGIFAVFVLRWLPEKKATHAETKTSERAASAPLPIAFFLLLGATTIFMAGNSSDAFLILRSKDIGLSTTFVVLAYVAYNLVYAALSLPAGIVSDRLPRAWLLALGYVVFGAVYAGFAFVDSTVAVWPLFAVYGAYIALTDGVSKALIADLVPSDVRSTAMGLFQGIAGLMALVASVAAGILWDQVSPRAPFALGAVCAALAAVALVVLALSGAINHRGGDLAV